VPTESRMQRIAAKASPASITLAVTALGSIVVFFWAVWWNYSIGVTASDTGGDGGNNAAWLWLFGSFALAALSLIALRLVVARPSRSRAD
jgi:hypothetical protein